MFGRSSDAVAPVQQDAGDPGAPGGRSAAISILPGMPLPHDLIQELPAAPEPEVAAPAPTDERELVTVGAGQLETQHAFGAGTAVPPPPAAPAAPTKRKSFSGLRRRGKAAEVETPAGFFDDEAALTPATSFAPAEPGPAPTFPAGFDAPHADPAHATEGHEAHVLTEVHVVSEHTLPVAAPEFPSVPTSFHPTVPAAPVDDVAMFPSTMPDDTVVDFNPTGSNPPAQPAAAAPPAYVPPTPPAPPVAPAPVASDRGPIVDEDPLFLHVPVLTGNSAAETAVPTAAAPPAQPAPARRSFLAKLRGGAAPAAPAAPVDAPAGAPVTDADVPPPFTPPVAGAVQPPPYTPFMPPTSAAPAPSYVPLGAPPAATTAPPAEAELAAPVAPAAPVADSAAPAVPSFGNLVPSQPAAYPELPTTESVPGGGLVFADGSHAELPAGDMAALQHVANVLAGDDAKPAGGDEANGDTAPIE